jgi:hypothetical protein
VKKERNVSEIVVKMRTGLNWRVMGYSDGFYGDDGESLISVEQEIS